MLISTIQNKHEQILAKHYMNTNNKKKLQTRRGMDSRHIQKVNCSDKKYWENTQLLINIVINDRLTCSVNKVNMNMIIYAFLITIGLLIIISKTNHISFTLKRIT